MSTLYNSCSPPKVYIWVDIPFESMKNFGGKSKISKMIYEVKLNYTMIYIYTHTHREIPTVET